MFIELERRSDVEMEAVTVGVVNDLIDGRRITRGRLLEDSRQRRAGVLGIEIQLTGKQRLMTQ